MLFGNDSERCSTASHKTNAATTSVIADICPHGFEIRSRLSSHDSGAGMEEKFDSRKHPVHGVFRRRNTPTIIYVTFCTRHRDPWLANEEVHLVARQVWLSARAWYVGRYIIMPDHIHLFAAPGEQE